MRLGLFTAEQCLKLRRQGISTTQVHQKPPFLLGSSYTPFFQPHMQEFLSATVLDLMTSLSLSYWQVLPLMQALSHAAAPTPTNVCSLSM